jgi:hypothetical protein
MFPDHVWPCVEDLGLGVLQSQAEAAENFLPSRALSDKPRHVGVKAIRLYGNCRVIYERQNEGVIFRVRVIQMKQKRGNIEACQLVPVTGTVTCHKDTLT